MNRDALLLYLRDLRDLEVANYQLSKVIQQNTNKANTMAQNLQREINQVQKPDYWERPLLPENFERLAVIGIPLIIFSLLILAEQWTLYVLLFLGLLGTLIVSFVVMVFSGNLTMVFYYGLHVFGSWAVTLFFLLPYPLTRSIFKFIIFVGIGIVIYATVRYIPAYTKQCEETEKHNQQENERLAQVPAVVQEKTAHKQALINSWKTKDTILKRDLQNATILLQKAYGQNLLASTYRNLASVYYIYDYMSTSIASLEETLMHEHMENGIQRILSKLDVIIGKQEEQIIATRQIESNTKTIIEQNEHMLDTLQQTLASQLRTEHNTLVAAQYARIATTYAETNAFFSSAAYFQNGGSLLIR